jgi:hypothetical protein
MSIVRGVKPLNLLSYTLGVSAMERSLSLYRAPSAASGCGPPQMNLPVKFAVGSFPAP